MSETKKGVSQMQIRAKIQELIAEHVRPSIGRFHAKELNEKGFVNDLLKKFEITPKESQ
jgi:hypothetical protein